MNFFLTHCDGRGVYEHPKSPRYYATGLNQRIRLISHLVCLIPVNQIFFSVIYCKKSEMKHIL